MSTTERFSLFEVTGIELEYMVVDRNDIGRAAHRGRSSRTFTGVITGDVERGEVDWSNELVSHVVELKTAMPTPDIAAFRAKFPQERESDQRGARQVRCHAAAHRGASVHGPLHRNGDVAP